jgi:SAM-dependent methyltransferase
MKTRPLERIHERHVYGRRVRVLAEAVARLIPPGARVLDVGCGDGVVGSLILRLRPDIHIAGVEVQVRPGTRIPVSPFDGLRLPGAAGSVDAVLLIDVLHHARDPRRLLAEAGRLAPLVIVKDHTREGILAGATLRFMDRVGNRRHGVDSSGEYWTVTRWRAAIREAGLQVATWRRDLPLYPWYASWLFGRSLHVLATLTRHDPARAPARVTSSSR